MELEAETPSAHSTDSDEVMSASSTLFFEQTDVILVVDDVSFFFLSLGSFRLMS